MGTSHVRKAEQCPGGILVVRNFVVPSAPRQGPVLLALPLTPSCGFPSGWPVWSDSRGFLGVLRELGVKHFQKARWDDSQTHSSRTPPSSAVSGDAHVSYI